MQIPAGWPERYPAEALRLEVDAMSAAWVEALTAHLPTGAVRGIYRKGSAQKRWDTRIDYVPELSDVDIHVLLRSEEDVARHEDIDFAITVNRAVRDGYGRRVPSPVHFPKPQLVIANQLEAQPDVAQSPQATVKTLFGEPYEGGTLTDPQQARQRIRSREQLAAHADFIARLPGRAIDRLAAVRPLIGELNWRVSPVAPRLLEVLGEPYDAVWSLNRTQLIAVLQARGLSEFVEAYATYYLRGWDAFIATQGSTEEVDGHLEVLRAGMRVVTLGQELAASLP